MRLAGKVALVTGGGSGIGRGISARFAGEGADIAIADVNRAGAEETGQQVRGLERRTQVIEADVTSKADCERMVRETVEALGKIDIFVANAGIGRAAPFLEFSEEDWNAVIQTNLTGVFLSCQAAARRMVEQGQGGRMITIASLAAEQAYPGMAPYNAAKAGVRMLTRVMALELAAHGITVNAIGPGLIDTPLTAPLMQAVQASGRQVAPLGRTGEPKDVADVALFLASEDAGYVTGGLIFADGGMAAGRMR
ncbi:MAG: SDR family NAD(P)-dependent oxidoreductase [Dehalococcoidia bacterium]